MSENSKSKNRWFAVGAVVVAASALLFITVSGIGENLVYYWGPADIAKAGRKAVGATIRLGGQVAPGSVKQSSAGSLLEFEVMDATNRVPVRSMGVPPQMFREGIGVVVEGTMTREGYFESDRLMVSHSNEYRAPTDTNVDPKALMKTTEGIAPEERK